MDTHPLFADNLYFLWQNEFFIINRRRKRQQNGFKKLSKSGALWEKVRNYFAAAKTNSSYYVTFLLALALFCHTKSIHKLTRWRRKSQIYDELLSLFQTASILWERIRGWSAMFPSFMSMLPYSDTFQNVDVAMASNICYSPKLAPGQGWNLLSLLFNK